MQEKTTIARPYARAIFELASQEKKLPEWSAMLSLLETIVMDAQMKQILVDPRLDAIVRADVILSLGAQKFSKRASNLVRVLADAGRLAFVPEIKALYEQFRATAEGITEVTVVSAYKLTAEQESSLATAMAKRLGKKVEINSQVNVALLGGIVIRSGDMVIDASLKGRLNVLSNELTS